MQSALFFLLVALGSGAQSQETSDAASGEYRAGISAGRVREEDPAGGSGLDGYRLGFVAFSKGRTSRFGFVGSWYVERKESRRQETLEGGLELAYPYFDFSRAGCGPRMRLALQRRDRPPDRDKDAVFGVGFECGVFLFDRVQVAAIADRLIGIDTGARSSFSVNMRVIFWKD
jgi:hypothetical protein